MQPDAEAGDLAAMLSAHHALLSGWRRVAPAAIPSALHAELAQRLRLLESDLGGLAALVAWRAPDATRFPSWPAASAAWWGAYYVIAGSQLGTRVIARHLRTTRLAGLDAFAFLEARTARPWPERIDAIAAALRGAPALEAGIDGALHTFSCFRAALEQAAGLPRVAA